MPDEIYKQLLKISEDIGHIRAVAEATHEQAKRTNGRVTSLEKDHTTLATKVYTWATLLSAGVGLAINKFL